MTKNKGLFVITDVGSLVLLIGLIWVLTGFVFLFFEAKRPLGKKALLAGFLGIAAGAFIIGNGADLDARNAGWPSAEERRQANKAGVSDPKLLDGKIEAGNEQAVREAGWASFSDREKASKAGFSDPRAWNEYQEAKANAERVLAAMAERDAAERAAAERAAPIERALIEEKAKAQAKNDARSDARFEGCKSKLIAAQGLDVLYDLDWKPPAEPKVVVGPTFFQIPIYAKEGFVETVNCFLSAGRNTIFEFDVLHWQTGKPVGRFRRGRFKMS
jgi:hypothetical protein